MKKETITFSIIFSMLLLLPSIFAAIGSSGSYNSRTKTDFIGSSSDSSAGHNSRESGDVITGSFSVSSYSGRFGILKYCGNRIIDSGETCDGTNLNSQTCSSRGYSSGTLACNADCSGFDTSGCTPVAAVKPVETPGGSSTGAAPSVTEFSSVTSVDVVKGGFAVFTTAQSASFTSKGVNYIADVKQIGEDFVRIWVYYPPESTKQIEPIEAVISIGKRANIDLDGDSWADVSIELRGLKDGNAFLYFKELKSQGPSKISIPTGKQVLVEEVGEEGFELPKITLIPKGLAPTEIGMKLLQNFESLVKEKVDYWKSHVKTKKSWLLPSAAFIGLLVLFFARSFSFYLQKRGKKKT